MLVAAVVTVGAVLLGAAASPAKETIADVNALAPPGAVNFRASHDGFTSHSEPSIAMDPLDHDHLIAGSKMYENNAKYLFKIGTYESFDGGRTWEDYGQLPGYCGGPGQCDPKDQDHYRTTSDVSVAFDDEGNAYAEVLDAPGGTFHFTGFNITIHIKHPGQPWSGPITIHDNRSNPITESLLLDDKNWLTIDNVTDVNGGPNRPRDGKIGTMYACWGLDQSSDQSDPNNPLGLVPGVGQIIVVMRSLDGGKTWGGILPGDNLPYPVSQKPLVAGIGCHIAIGPQGQVYATWTDTQLGALMQAESLDRGALWLPAHPIATINQLPPEFNGEAFRNTSIPVSAVDPRNGTVYVAVASVDAAGQALSESVQQGFETLLDAGKDPVDALHEALDNQTEADEGADGSTGGDIVLFKSTNGGLTYSGPIRVNQDPRNVHRDQFQPWMVVTPNGQIDISYFDRRNDPRNLYIDTYLSRSDDGGQTFHDTRVTSSVWDPRINAPVSVSGAFIGDYQGLAADDSVAIPFWNDTQDAALPPSDPNYSPWQEVMAARIPNGPSEPATGSGKPSCRDTLAPTARFTRAAQTARRRRLVLSGRASDRSNCRRARAGVRRVVVSVALRTGKRCRFLRSDGRLGTPRSCARQAFLPARGTTRWSFTLRRRLPRGRYRVAVKAMDRAGNAQSRPTRRSLRVR
jgi:hypothetical protein